MDLDPIVACPQLYRVVLENDHVRVLEYRDVPGDRAVRHHHPDSVMITLAGFERRVFAGDRQVELTLQPHEVRWLSAQEHTGENIGQTPSWAYFVELKDPARAGDGAARLPSSLGPDPAIT